MRPCALIDLHCDTLTAMMAPGQCADTLNDPRSAISLSALPTAPHWAQCFAIFIPDELTGRGADRYYHTHQASFCRQMEKFSHLAAPCRTAEEVQGAWGSGRTAAILTVENGSALAGKLDRIDLLARDGVRMMTLTWNGVNELGSGNNTGQGLTPFGRKAIRRMEAVGMLVDVSHLNDRGFADLLDTARRPFVASHSNARAVCSHRRNLTDDQIREMVERKCLIGLNYYHAFLRDGGGARPEDLRRHVEHFLALGAQDCLALGSDFDGADVPAWLAGPEQAVGLYDRFRAWGFSSALCDKILYRNALDFFRVNLG